MIPNFLRNDNAHGQGLIQRDARFLDLKDEVATDLIDHGNGLPHDKAKLGQMLADTSLPVIFRIVTVSPALVIVKGIPHTPLLQFCNILAYANAWSKSMRLERSNRLQW